MNGRFRLAALAPLLVSSLAVGSVPLVAGSAQAVAPTATCHVTQSPGSSLFNIIGQGLTPGAEVTIKQANSTIIMTAGADGKLSGSAGLGATGGPVTMQEKGGPTLSCGTVEQAEQQDAQDQFKKGFTQGFALAKATCKEQAPQGAVAVDPNFEKGFKEGAAAAIAQFCKG
ncbi:hypothetical protein [Streptomyces sp. P9-A2]|uniref:hypothetical protein n=1 Tax=Streptomyces sp. P9-A2 TaxID=3072284 RepID=UPI002FC61688